MLFILMGVLIVFFLLKNYPFMLLIVNFFFFLGTLFLLIDRNQIFIFYQRYIGFNFIILSEKDFEIFFHHLSILYSLNFLELY